MEPFDSASNDQACVFRPGLLDGRVAIVTGGATGIGKAITKELLFLGCNVVVASRKLDRLENGARDIREWLKSAGQKSAIHVIQCNVRKEDEVKRLISQTIEVFGKLDFLINNGGGQFMSTTADITFNGWNAVVETNLMGTFLMCREAYTQWMQDHGGVIINMAMDMWNGFPGMAHSAAARAGVVNLTKTLGVEWAQSNARVNCVAPGSSIVSPTAVANYGGETSVFAGREVNIPSKRMGTVEEISSAVCFLLSPGAAFITGQTLRIDGGQSFYINSNTILPDSEPTDVYEWQSIYNSDSGNIVGVKSKL